MTALAADRTPVVYGSEVIPKLLSIGAKANTLTYKGSLVVNDAGAGAPGYAATTLVALGVAVEQVNNVGGLVNAKTIQVESGVFDFANSAAGDAIAATEIGKNVYIVDDATVAKTDGTGTRSIAGKVVKVENGRVFVLVGIGV